VSSFSLNAFSIFRARQSTLADFPFFFGAAPGGLGGDLGAFHDGLFGDDGGSGGVLGEDGDFRLFFPINDGFRLRSSEVLRSNIGGRLGLCGFLDLDQKSDPLFAFFFFLLLDGGLLPAFSSISSNIANRLATPPFFGVAADVLDDIGFGDGFGFGFTLDLGLDLVLNTLLNCLGGGDEELYWGALFALLWNTSLGTGGGTEGTVSDSDRAIHVGPVPDFAWALGPHVGTEGRRGDGGFLYGLDAVDWEKRAGGLDVDFCGEDAVMDLTSFLTFLPNDMSCFLAAPPTADATAAVWSYMVPLLD